MYGQWVTFVVEITKSRNVLIRNVHINNINNIYISIRYISIKKRFE
jgi:pectate lyase